jgi:GNAT superfamily N-acetyltransferase
MKRLKYFPVETAEHVELMRHIYNDNLDMLSTRPLPRREYQDQQDWWAENRHALKAYLFERVDNPGHPMAFLVLRDRGGFVTPIIAIEKAEWGKGFGREIIQEYIALADGPLAGSQLVSNLSICHLNRQLGWQIVGSRMVPAGEIQLLFHPGVHPRKLDAKTIQGIAEYLELPLAEVSLKLEQGVQ